MKTITTKYLPITATLPARVSASDEDGNKVTIVYDGDKDHDIAAHKLCKKMDWNKHNLVRGNQKGGNVYVFLDADAVIPLADPLIANKIAHALKPNERALDAANDSARLELIADLGIMEADRDNLRKDNKSLRHLVEERANDHKAALLDRADTIQSQEEAMDKLRKERNQLHSHIEKLKANLNTVDALRRDHLELHRSHDTLVRERASNTSGLDEATDKLAFLRWLNDCELISHGETSHGVLVALSNAWIKHKIALAAAIPTDPAELAAQVETANELFAEIKAEEKVERPNPLANVWDVFRKTDWTELRAQKQAVVHAQQRGGSIADYEKFEGLVNFLDAVQDAAEAAGFPAYPEINYADLTEVQKAHIDKIAQAGGSESVPESDPDLATLTSVEANAWAETPGIGWQESLRRRQLVDAVETFKSEPETLPVARLQIVNHGTHSSSEAFVSAQVFGAGDKGDITEQLAAEHKGSQLILDDITIADGQIIEFNPGRVTATPGKRFRINITELV